MDARDCAAVRFGDRAMTGTSSLDLACPICAGKAVAHDVVDFSKSCVEGSGTFLPLCGVPIYYFLCGQCGLCFAPEMYRWTPDEFGRKIYNEEYTLVDPDWIEARPRGNAQHLAELFGAQGAGIRHLDYGGGIGLLSDLLQGAGWNSRSYDPFVDRDVRLEDLGKFDLITSFEVFEHVPDSLRLIDELASLLDENGLIYFSTLVTEGNIAPHQRLTWWYAAPRNGHITLYTRNSLAILGARQGFRFGSITTNLHLYWRQVPAWAQQLFARG